MVWGCMTVSPVYWASMVRWQLPYLIGRLYFSDAEGLRELAIGIVIGGLACVLALLVRDEDESSAPAPGLRHRPI